MVKSTNLYVAVACWVIQDKVDIEHLSPGDLHTDIQTHTHKHTDKHTQTNTHACMHIHTHTHTHTHNVEESLATTVFV